MVDLLSSMSPAQTSLITDLTVHWHEDSEKYISNFLTLDTS